MKLVHTRRLRRHPRRRGTQINVLPWGRWHEVPEEDIQKGRVIRSEFIIP